MAKVTIWFVRMNESTQGESAESLEAARTRAAVLLTNPEVKFLQVKDKREDGSETRYQWYRESGTWTTKEVPAEKPQQAAAATPEQIAALPF